MFGCHHPHCPGHDDVLAAIRHTQEAIMSTLDDLTATTAQLAAAVTAIGGAVSRIETDFDALKASLPPAGTLTADQQAALDAAVSSLGSSVTALTTAAASVDAADPVPAAPVA